MTWEIICTSPGRSPSPWVNPSWYPGEIPGSLWDRIHAKHANWVCSARAHVELHELDMLYASLMRVKNARHIHMNQQLDESPTPHVKLKV